MKADGKDASSPPPLFIHVGGAPLPRYSPCACLQARVFNPSARIVFAAPERELERPDLKPRFEEAAVEPVPVESLAARAFDAPPFRSFEGLPLCLVKDWDELSESFLNAFLAKLDWRACALEKLDFSYWRKRIREAMRGA